jgi:multiple sugar transport system permease protein
MNYARREEMWGYIFVTPFLVLFLVFVLVPTIMSVVMAVLEWYDRKPVYVGLTNIEFVLQDQRFWHSVRNTLSYAGMFVFAAIVLALAVAIRITKFRSQGVRQGLQSAFYLPSVVSLVAVAVVWRYIFNNQFGMINYLLSLVGMEPVNWLGNTQTALPSLVFMDLVTGLGVGIIIFVAAVLGLPSDLFDAAHIDGATGWLETIYITIPLLTPSILYVAVTTTIVAMQLFVSVFFLTKGGPVGSTLTLAFLTYRYAFVFLKIGYASAVGLALLLLTLALAMVLFRWFRSVVEY